VSLLPPPCDELTTSEPSRSATRVRAVRDVDLGAEEGERSKVDAGRDVSCPSIKVGATTVRSSACAMKSRGLAR